MLEDKVVVITGVAGGLGSALARAFIAEGCYVVGITRSAASGNALTDELGERFVILSADVSNPNEVAVAFNEISERFGRVDYLFNNAAVYPRKNFLDESAQEWLDAILINLGGISNCCKSAIPLMMKSGYGRIYNLGSFADIRPIKNSVAYSCSKGGVHGLTKAIAADIEYLQQDIEIHEWVPGHLKTKMSDFTGIDPAVSAAWAVNIAKGTIKSSKNSTLFENDKEWLPPVSFKQRLKRKLLFWKSSE